MIYSKGNSRFPKRNKKLYLKISHQSVHILYGLIQWLASFASLGIHFSLRTKYYFSFRSNNNSKVFQKILSRISKDDVRMFYRPPHEKWGWYFVSCALSLKVYISFLYYNHNNRCNYKSKSLRICIQSEDTQRAKTEQEKKRPYRNIYAGIYILHIFVIFGSVNWVVKKQSNTTHQRNI